MESILLNNIDQYYSLVDKNIIDQLCQNESLNNLINLSTKTDIYIFNKKNNKWQLKSKNKILHECEQIKKKEIKTSSTLLSNLSKLNNIIDLDNVKNIYKNLENKIDNINKFVTCLNNVSFLSDTKKLDISTKLKSKNASYLAITEDDFNPLKIQKSKNTILDLGSETKRLINTLLNKQKKYYTNSDKNTKFKTKLKIDTFNKSKTIISTETENNSDLTNFIACYSNC